jgi:hypothetical protein
MVMEGAMAGTTFKTLTRMFSATPSRRELGRALAGLTAGGLPGLWHSAEMDAGRRPRKRRRRKRRRKNREHICQGRDACVDGIAAACDPSDGSCFCFADAGGEPICAKGNTVTSCEQCEQQFPGRLCFPGTGPQCGAFSCVEECDV